MVLGVLDATRRIPDGAQVAVDGVAGIVRWLPDAPRQAARIFVTQPVAASALERLRKVASVKVIPDSSRIIPKRTLIAACAKPTSCSACCTTAIDRAVIAANPKLRADRGAVDHAVQHRRRRGDRRGAFPSP